MELATISEKRIPTWSYSLELWHPSGFPVGTCSVHFFGVSQAWSKNAFAHQNFLDGSQKRLINIEKCDFKHFIFTFVFLNHFEPLWTLWNHLKPFGIFWNLLKTLRTFWSLMEPYGTKWNLREPFGTLRNSWEIFIIFLFFWNWRKILLSHMSYQYKQFSL